jgi:hypothetical protein
MTALKESLGLVFVMYAKTRLQVAQHELKDGAVQTRPVLRLSRPAEGKGAR